MKRLLLISALALLFSSCNRIPKEERVLVAQATDSIVVISVPKAVCVNCQNVIEGGLAKQEGVKQSIMNLHTREVSIVYEPESTSAEVLKERIEVLKGQLPCK